MVSASGGLAEPSILSVLAFARRAVIASREGMFLYPTGIFCLGLSSLAGGGAEVSWLSFSTISVVSGSPFSPEGVLPLLRGGEMGSWAGDSARVMGGFTMVESDVDAAAEEVLELVRRRAAARRGRLAALAGVGASSLMRAASWLREGMRVAEALRSGLPDASWAVVVAAGGGVVDIVGVGGQDSSSSNALAGGG